MKNFPQQMTHSSGAPMLQNTNRLLLTFHKPVAREAAVTVISFTSIFFL